MNSAPMIEPEIVATPPMRIIAMNCTDISRLKLPAVNVCGIDVEQRAGDSGVERGDRERDHLVPGQVHADHRRRRCPGRGSRRRPGRCATARGCGRAGRRSPAAPASAGTAAGRGSVTGRRHRYGCRTGSATGAGRPMSGGPAIAVHSRNTYCPMKTSPSVTIARYSPRRRMASGATRAPATRRQRPGGQQPDRHLGDAEAEDPAVRVAGQHSRGVRADRDEESVAQRNLTRVAGDDVQPDRADRQRRTPWPAAAARRPSTENGHGQRDDEQHRRRTPSSRVVLSSAMSWV